jgi:LacI family transcriptional regulator
VNLETDEETGAYQLVRHLIQCGHRRILHLTGEPGRIGTERRIRAYRRALLDGGVVVDPTLIVDCAFNPTAGRNAMGAWLRDHAGEPLPDAIFGANDGIAVGVLEALTKAGYSVPRDVSVAGFDDTLAARTASPALTTVRQPLREMGQQAVEALLKQIRGDAKGSADVQTPLVLPTELVVRASVAERTRNGSRS